MKNDSFIDLYLKWLKDNMRSKLLDNDSGQYTQISTPFLDRHNDHIQLYVEVIKENILRLTDDSYTISDLEMCGCDITSSPKRRALLSTILNGFGVSREQDELYVTANYSNFPQKKHSLIQAILAINDMFFLSKSQVANMFLEDVQSFLDNNDILYVPNAQFNGVSGLTHTFQYTLPATRKKPERYIRAINDVNRDKIDSALFAWGDIKENRDLDSQLFVILNDSEKKIKNEYQNALNNYGAKTILWSKREMFIKDLAS